MAWQKLRAWYDKRTFGWPRMPQDSPEPWTWAVCGDARQFVCSAVKCREEEDGHNKFTNVTENTTAGFLSKRNKRNHLSFLPLKIQHEFQLSLGYIQRRPNWMSVRLFVHPADQPSMLGQARSITSIVLFWNHRKFCNYVHIYPFFQYRPLISE